MVGVPLSAVLDKWRSTIGQIDEIDVRLLQLPGIRGVAYIIRTVNDGQFRLQAHPDDVAEGTILDSARFAAVLPSGLAPKFLPTDDGNLATFDVATWWTLSPHPAPFSTTAAGVLDWNPTLERIRSAARALAEIHASGFAYLSGRSPQDLPKALERAGRLEERFAKLSWRVHGSAEKAKAALRPDPLGLLRALVPREGWVEAPKLLRFDRERQAKVAKILLNAQQRWRQDGSKPRPGLSTWAGLGGKLFISINTLRGLEDKYGAPRTVTHENFGPWSLVFEGENVRDLDCWAEGIHIGSPVEDAAYAAVALCARWSKSFVPHMFDKPVAFDDDGAAEFCRVYISSMTELCDARTMSTPLRQALHDVEYWRHYMNVACYAMLLRQVEQLLRDTGDEEQSFQVILMVLHISSLQTRYDN
jgi:hypothetical protein